MQTVFITGASSGLGKALAQEYAAQGACLGLLGRRQEELQALADSLPGEHRIYVADVRDRDALHQAAQDFLQFTGQKIDVVIASAGISAGTLTIGGAGSPWLGFAKLSWLGMVFAAAGLLLLLVQHRHHLNMKIKQMRSRLRIKVVFSFGIKFIRIKN